MADLSNREPAWQLAPSPGMAAQGLPADLSYNQTNGEPGRYWGPDGRLHQAEKGALRPRYSPLHGEFQGLLVEPPRATNYLSHSASISKTHWDSIDMGQEKEAESLVAGHTAYEHFDDPATSGDGRISQTIGELSGGPESFSVIAEQGTATVSQFLIKNHTVRDTLLRRDYNWLNGEFSKISGTSTFEHVRKLADIGPNGGAVFRFTFGYNSGNSQNVAGDVRRFGLRPDANNNGESVIYHHAQLEERKNVSSPIVTGAEAKTRGEDRLDLSPSEWWNYEGGTFYVEGAPLVIAPSRTETVLGKEHNRGYFEYSTGFRPIARDVQNHRLLGNESQIHPFTTYKMGIAFNRDRAEMYVDQSDQGNNTSFDQSLTERTGLRIVEGDPHLIRNIRYYPDVLSSSELEVLTRSVSS